MASRTRSSLSSKRKTKAQFFVLSAFIMITILFVMSQFIQPSQIFDTSSAIFVDEIFIFNNIKEKSIELVQISDNCNDLALNLAEFEQFANNFVLRKNADLIYNYQIVQPCADATRTTNFYIAIVSTSASVDSTFTAEAG